MSFRVVVPASSANLGPGFDSMAIALSRYMTVTVEPGDGDSSNAQQAEIGNGRDMVLDAMQYLADRAGRSLPDVRITSQSAIPVARGMGSSAAAIMAGMLVANRLLDNPMQDDEVLQLASEIEGHADNLAAALYGGAVLAVPTSSNYLTVELAIGMDLEAVMLVPSTVGFTTDARAVVPEHVNRSDGVFNSSRCALLVHALASGNAGLLAEAMKDRWHQPYRAALYSYLEAVIACALESGACGASLSGSGPTVLALTEPQHSRNVAMALENLARERELACSIEIVAIDRDGASVIEGTEDSPNSV